MKYKLFMVALLIFGLQAQAQFLKKIGKSVERAAKRTVEYKVEEKTEKESEKVFDSIFNNSNEKKIFKKKKRKKKRKSKKQQEQSQGSENETQDTTVNYTSDFESGSQVIFQETFDNVSLNDFPGTWNTNGSGSIVTLGNDSKKWLRMDPNVSFTPDGITTIPINSTLEFDLKVDDNYYKISKGIDIVIAGFTNKDQDFNQYYNYKGRKNSVVIRLDPVTHTSYGSFANTFVDNKEVLDTSLGQNGFNKDNRTVHISIWRQETRLRFYIDGQKIWDLPRAFVKGINYNTLLFGTYKGKPDDAFYISNIRLAKAAEDTREKLLDNGSFSTSDIQFDSGKSTLKASGISIIEQLVTELNESPNAAVTITGHTDSDGNASSNLTLSRARAYAVKEKMIKLGVINYDRITVQGLGDTQPLVPNNSNTNKALNRRVEFTINQ